MRTPLPAAASVLLLTLAAAACGDAAREAPGAGAVSDTSAALDAASAPTATAVVRDSAGRELGTLTQ